LLIYNSFNDLRMPLEWWNKSYPFETFGSSLLLLALWRRIVDSSWTEFVFKGSLFLC